MVLSIIIGLAFITLVLSVIPRLMRAQVRGRAESLALGHAPTGIPMTAGDGLRRVSLGGGEIGAGAIAAALQHEGIEVRVDTDTGGSFGGVNASYTILYREDDEQHVLDVIAAHVE